MKVHDKYRFTLQWSSDTAEKVQAGEFLESLGNKKSEIIVLAVTEYLEAHPALVEEQKPKIIIKRSYTAEQVKAIILAVLRDEAPGAGFISQESQRIESNQIVTETDIDEMLNNLIVFS